MVIKFRWVHWSSCSQRKKTVSPQIQLGPDKQKFWPGSSTWVDNSVRATEICDTVSVQ